GNNRVGLLHASQPDGQRLASATFRQLGTAGGIRADREHEAVLAECGLRSETPAGLSVAVVVPGGGSMRVAAYAHLHRTHAPSGVGQHLIQMLGGLDRWPDVELTVIAPRAQLDAARRIPAGSPLSGVPARALPFRRRWLETMWQ